MGRARTFAGQLEGQVVDITPIPVFTRLEGLDERMTGRVVMGGRVPIRRRVAAPNVSAGRASPKMNPPAAHEEAFDAAVATRLDVCYSIQMAARLSHARHATGLSVVCVRVRLVE